MGAGIVVAAAVALLALPGTAAARDVQTPDGAVYRSGLTGRYFHPLASFGKLNRAVTAGNRVRARRISDVIRQTKIETARKRAADVAAARRIGVKLEAETGQIKGTTNQVVTVPLPAGSGRQAFGFITRTTVMSIAERFYDARRVRDWTDEAGKLAVLPQASSSVRALIPN